MQKSWGNGRNHGEKAEFAQGLDSGKKTVEIPEKMCQIGLAEKTAEVAGKTAEIAGKGAKFR